MAAGLYPIKAVKGIRATNGLERRERRIGCTSKRFRANTTQLPFYQVGYVGEFYERTAGEDDKCVPVSVRGSKVVKIDLVRSFEEFHSTLKRAIRETIRLIYLRIIRMALSRSIPRSSSAVNPTF
jgi:hypothetical protein